MNLKSFSKKYIEEDDRIGDIVRDMFEDKDFPWSIKKNLKYLIEKGACKEAIECYEDLLELYRKNKK